jgi:hypothetical protein
MTRLAFNETRLATASPLHVGAPRANYPGVSGRSRLVVLVLAEWDVIYGVRPLELFV